MMRSRSRFLFGWVLAMAVLMLSGPAGAADPPAGDTISKRVAELYKKANALYDDKKLPEAEATYLEAWNLKKTYDVACNLGAIELDRGKPRDAAEHLAFALREFPAGGKSSFHDLIEGRFKKAREQVGALRIRVNLAGARVSAGGRPVGVSPLVDEVFVLPGSVTIEASLPGYDPVKQTLMMTQGGSTDVNLALKGAGRSLVPAFIMGGVGVAALGAGVALFVVGSGKGSDAQSGSAAILSSGHSCVPGAANFDAQCDALSSTAKTGSVMHNTGVGLIAGGGALGVGAVVYYLWPATKPGAQGFQSRVTPIASQNSGGLIWSGAF